MFLVRIPDWEKTENSPTLPNSFPFCWVVGNYLRQRLEGEQHTQTNEGQCEEGGVESRPNW